METAKLSQEIFAIPYGNNFIVYAPLQGAAILCNTSMVNFLHDLYIGDESVIQNSSYLEIVNSLKKANILIESEALGKENSVLSLELTSSVFSPTRATFLVTTNCNLRCVYCYASAGERHVTIPFEICKAAIDLVIRNGLSLDVGDCHFAFHGGGEPTTAFPLIRQCVNYARKQSELNGMLCTFSIVTNGILNTNQIEWLATNMNGISVSLDGPPDIQNRQRPMPNGKGSFDFVFNTVKAFERLGAHPFVRATITNESVGEMREISRFFSENFESDEFQLEPVAVCGRCSKTGYREPTVEDFVNGVESAMEEAAKFGKKAVCSAALETFPNLLEAYCGVAAPNFAVTPEGIVTACYEVSLPDDPKGEYFYYGRYDFQKREFLFDANKIHQLRHHVIQNIKRCSDCFCRWQCAGDCPVRSSWQFANSTTSKNVNFRCQMTRELVKRRLVTFIEELSNN